MKVAAIVPSLKPGDGFYDVIEGLVSAGFQRIYIVDDGSGEEYAEIFRKAAEPMPCVLLTHEVNCGKGRALKTAMNRYLLDDEGFAGVVTLDGDGQHHIGDVVNVARALEENSGSLILGVRDFAQSDVPAKSSLGNRITRSVFRVLFGLTVTDTQTGLRGIPNGFAKRLLDVGGERYEFETNMLLETGREGVEIFEVPIHTIYIDDNSGSHFRPLWDSLRIYVLMLKFAMSSILSFLVDYGLFNLLVYLLRGMPAERGLFFATAGARVVSGVLNFSLNKTVVFKGGGKSAAAFLRYAALFFAQLLCSYGGVYLLSGMAGVPAAAAKILVDVLLFVLSFFIQRKWVFKREA